MRAFCTSLVVVSLFCVTAYGRVYRSWSYNDLLQESDLVVIGNALKTTTVPSTDRFPERGSGAVGIGGSQAPVAVVVQQVETIFHVRAVVKGRVADKQLTLVHFRWKNEDERRKDRKQDRGDPAIMDGPRLVEFPTDNGLWDPTSEKVVKAGHDCILFLKLRKDRKYEPISGQVDPVFSVRWLTELIPASPSPTQRPQWQRPLGAD